MIEQGTAIKQKANAYGMVKIWEEGANAAKLSPIEQFLQLCSQAFISIKLSPVISAVTTLTMALALFLFAAFLLVLINVGVLLKGSGSAVELNIFLADGVDASQLQVLQAEMAALPGIGKVSYLSSAEALKEFRAELGSQHGLLEGLDSSNPLPASLRISSTNPETAQALFEQISKQYAKHPLVTEVQYSAGLLGQLSSLISLFTWGGSVAVILMLVMIGFILGSTIKLALFSRGEELDIMRLVGVTPRAIRAPCMIEGALLGCVGALLGLLALYLSFIFVNQSWQSSEVLKLVAPQLTFIGVGAMLLVVALGVFVGLVGSYFAVRPFLIER